MRISSLSISAAPASFETYTPSFFTKLQSAIYLFRNSALADLVWVLLLTCVVPNVALWILFGHDFQRGFLNLEWGALVSLYIVWRRLPFLILFGFSLLTDLFAPIARTFYFRVEDALSALRYLSVLPHLRLVEYCFALASYLVLALLSIWFGTRRVHRRPASAIGILIFSSALLVWGVAGGQYKCLNGCDESKSHTLAVRAPFAALMYRAYAARNHTASVAPQQIESPMSHLSSPADAELWAAKPNVVLISVESWGLLQDDVSRDALTASFSSLDIKSQYTVETGSVPFVGNTIFGESRDLCGQIFGNGLENSSAKQLDNCYPAEFAAKGYQTIGIHGFYPHMYGRERWFPNIGFHKGLFLPDLVKMGMHTCAGDFTGTCGADVAQYIHAQLSVANADHPTFIHWMTLDSHLPMNVNATGLTKADCEIDTQLSADQTLCAWHTVVKRVNQQIASIAADRTLSPTVFVVSGDHAPPFYSATRRALFSQQRVPYVILRPKLAGVSGVSEALRAQSRLASERRRPS